MRKTDPTNIALVALLVMNVLAVLQFQSLAWAGPLRTKAGTAEVASDRIAAAVGSVATFTHRPVAAD